MGRRKSRPRSSSAAVAEPATRASEDDIREVSIIHTIKVESEHPLIDMTVTDNAQRIAEELGHEGSHPFAVTVTAERKKIASWRDDLERAG